MGSSVLLPGSGLARRARLLYLVVLHTILTHLMLLPGDDQEGLCLRNNARRVSLISTTPLGRADERKPLAVAAAAVKAAEGAEEASERETRLAAFGAAKNRQREREGEESRGVYIVVAT